MPVPSRYTVAIHTLLCIAYFDGKAKTTSDFIAGSVNVNPVIIRQVLQKLKSAGLVTVERGTGGAALAKPASQISLLDVLDAIEGVKGALFSFHENPNPACPVGSAIKPLLSQKLGQAHEALNSQLAETSLEDLLREI